MMDQKQNRALTFTEMMNGGRQQMDDAQQSLENALKQRIDQLEQHVEHLKKSLSLGVVKTSEHIDDSTHYDGVDQPWSEAKD